MQFGFTNTLVTFQKRINTILAEHLNKFVITYLDNILIYLDNKRIYKDYIEQVLQVLAENKMPITIEKCEFSTTKTNFIGFIIKLGQISIDLKKVQYILKQAEPENVT